MTAYSSTPLAKKLGIKAGYALRIVNAPEDYFMFFDDLPEDLEEPDKPQKESLDFIHIFCTQQSELTKLIEFHKPLLKKTGMLWLSWPKGSSSINTDLKRDFIRELILGMGLVDVKVAAINDDWSGLKFMYRIKDR